MLTLFPHAWMVASAFDAGGVGLEVLEDSQDKLTRVYSFWDTVWEQTFFNVSGNSPYGQIVYMASVLLLLAFTSFCFTWGRQMLLPGGFVSSFQSLLPVLLAIALLQNNGQFIANLAYSSRLVFQGWQQSILTLQIGDTQIRAVLQDVLATSAVRDEIQRSIAHCDSLPAPATILPSLSVPTDPAVVNSLTPAQQQVYEKLSCYEALAAEAETLVASYENRGFCLVSQQTCARARRFVEQVNLANEQLEEEFQAQIDSGNVLGHLRMLNSRGFAFRNVALGGTVGLASKPILYAMQWAFAHLMELAFWLCGLMVPIAVASSAFHVLTARPLVTWFITFISIGFMQIFYILLIGVMATVVASSELGDTSDIAFGLMMGFFAPIIAIALTTRGALAAVAAVSSTSALIGSAVIGIAASAATSLVGLSRR